MTVTIDVRIEQKKMEAVAFVVVPAAAVAEWEISETTTIEGTLDGVPIGRRSLVRWDADRWFIEFRGGLTQAIGKSGGDHATLAIHIASAELPEELRRVLETDPDARERWEQHSSAQQRMIREEILAAKTSLARERRARKALGSCVRPPATRVAGLSATPTRVLVRVTGRLLPGTTCGPYTDVHVGMVQRVGCDPQDPVPADVDEMTWETQIDVRDVNGRPGFRGRAVNGPPHERFIYLTWLGRMGGAPSAMFRRAKLRLDAVPGEVLAAALESGVLVGELGLTDADRMPMCGSVRPPAISWRG